MARRVAGTYDAVIASPIGRLGIRAADGRLVDIDFLDARAASQPPRDPFVRRVCRELNAYFKDPRHAPRVPLRLHGTPHQRRVWRALVAIPPGQVRSYGEIARRVGSSARAVGGACRLNPIPIVVPCHRVVSASGIGGFLGRRSGSALDIKRRLLAHERRS
jgi:methylated-DNA-[protein]-cysteine S-methyltransferase